MVWHSLSKPERQKRVGQKAVRPHVSHKEAVIWQLKMLPLAADDPRRTYAQEHQQLRMSAKPAAEAVPTPKSTVAYMQIPP